MAVRHVAVQGGCPVCGRGMRETARVTEGEYIYVWYECSQVACGGTWLDKHPVSKTGQLYPMPWRTRQVAASVSV